MGGGEDAHILVVTCFSLWRDVVIEAQLANKSAECDRASALRQKQKEKMWKMLINMLSGNDQELARALLHAWRQEANEERMSGEHRGRLARQKAKMASAILKMGGED